MRIVIALPHLKAGGAERTASELANYMVARGDTVFLLLMYRREKFFALDPKVIILEPSWTEGRWGKWINVLHILLYLRRAIKEVQPDVVFAIGYMAFTLAASVGLNAKVIISGRSSPVRVRFPGNPILNGVYSLSHKALAPRVDGVIAQTRTAADRYRKLYSCPVEVIPNFLRKMDIEVIEKRNWIITVGRCDKEKGHTFLLQAFAKLQAPSWSLVIVGDGPQREALEALAVQLGIRERVHFEGFRKDVDHFLSQSKIFVFTSLHEGFPNALLEAMAAPLPCVSFDCVAGPSDIIRDGENGFLVPVGDVEGLKSRIQQLVDDEALRLYMEQNATVTRSQYAIGILGEKYREFFFRIAKPINS